MSSNLTKKDFENVRRKLRKLVDGYAFSLPFPIEGEPQQIYQDLTPIPIIEATQVLAEHQSYVRTTSWASTLILDDVKYLTKQMKVTDRRRCTLSFASPGTAQHPDYGTLVKVRKDHPQYPDIVHWAIKAQKRAVTIERARDFLCWLFNEDRGKDYDYRVFRTWGHLKRVWPTIYPYLPKYAQWEFDDMQRPAPLPKGFEFTKGYLNFRQSVEEMMRCGQMITRPETEDGIAGEPLVWLDR